MKLHIPPLGAVLTLASAWTFDLWDEYRNDAMISALKVKMPEPPRGTYSRNGFVSAPATLPAGTELIVRCYRIRLGQGAADRVTFSAKIGKKSHRFWVKLADANNIELEKDDD